MIIYYSIVTILGLGIALLPWRIGLLGRILGMMTASMAWLYASALGAGRPPTGIGALGLFVRLDPSPATVEGVTIAMSLLVAGVGAFSSHRLVRAHRFAKLQVRLPKLFTYSVLFVALASSIYLALALGVDSLFSYSGYGSIKAWQDIFVDDAVGRLIAVAFRPLAILVIVLAVANANNGDKGYLTLALPVVALALALGLSEASRIVAVYTATAAICLLLVGRRVLAMIALLAAFFSVAYALEARTQHELGLNYVTQYLSDALANEDLVAEVLTNVSSGLFVTSAAANVANEDGYSDSYKLLSFLPTVDAIDGFQAAKAQSEQRILSYLPFNAFAEAALFGPAYWVVFWGVLIASALAVNSSLRFGTIPFLALLCLFCLGWVFASQYPVRNSLRYFYILLVLRAMLPTVYRWIRHRRERQDSQIVLARTNAGSPTSVSIGASNR